ncbi:hypothetical protein AGR7A_Lc10267 [Agrobacterium deltaense NCPPB 1641]|uniref:Uncharacterized protein n=1 Tax=Agrobacterium deltaense NCPPB 1641 TaxID=1183425 RepID=A0A1S7TSH9_9HYPH|nr:hypothetical protein AGR7A_Lc10267 [Agrobacterium deltaense NCPPB 1641]
MRCNPRRNLFEVLLLLIEDHFLFLSEPSTLSKEIREQLGLQSLGAIVGGLAKAWIDTAGYPSIDERHDEDDYLTSAPNCETYRGAFHLRETKDASPLSLASLSYAEASAHRPAH